MLLDHNVPLPMRRALQARPRFRAETTVYRGRERLTNGDLLAKAEDAGFDLLVTADKSLRYQQNLSNRPIAVAGLAADRRNDIDAHLDEVIAAVAAMPTGSLVDVAFHGRTAKGRPTA